MATALLPEENILSITDIVQDAIQRAAESILELIQGGDIIPCFLKPESFIKKLNIGGWSFLPATEFYILYGDNPRCWRWIDYYFCKVAYLLHSDSIELKGMIEKEQFEAGKRYDVEFLIKMDNNAKLNTKSRFTTVLPEPKGKCSVHSKLVNLKEQVAPDEWTLVKVGDFIATESGEDIRFSLTNFDHYWKNGLTVAGVLTRPSTRD